MRWSYYFINSSKKLFQFAILLIVYFKIIIMKKIPYQSKPCRKLIIAFLCGCAFIAPSLLAASITFPDVSPSDWFFQDVNNLTEWGVVKGNKDGSFAPYRGANRAEISVMFSRYEKHLEDKFYSRDEVDRMIDDLKKIGFDSKREDSKGSFSAPKNVQFEDTVRVKDSDATPVTGGLSNNLPPIATIEEPQLSHRGVFFDSDPTNSLESLAPSISLANGKEVSAVLVTYVGRSIGAAAGVEPQDDWIAIEIFVRNEPLGTAYFLPEVGDEVLVAFESGDLSVPVSKYGIVGESFVLDGSKSQDDGFIHTFVWRQTKGPSIFATKKAETISVIPQEAGTFEFELIVTDNAGLQSAPSQVKVLILP